MTNLHIKKDITFCIRRNGVTRKIFKIFFQKNSPDFYVAFPYFPSNEYKIGTLTIPRTERTLLNFNADQNKKSSSAIPVKFSYHLSGAVHFKSTNPVRALVDFAYKYDSIQATPIPKLAGEHIFSITFEGLDNFLSLEEADSKKTPYILLGPPSTLQTFRITGFAGYSEQEVRGKYGNVIPALITIKRDQLSRPLLIAVYVLAGEQTIQTDSVPGPFLLSLVGFKKDDLSLDRDLSTLYLYAK